MTATSVSRIPVRLHLTNVSGAGASQLLLSLLPAMERDPGVFVKRIELPDRGRLATYQSSSAITIGQVYRRHLPNALSRILECTFLAGRFDGDSPLLVMGDLPLRCRGPQTVFLQQSNLLRPDRIDWHLSSLKYALSRAVFRWNLDRVRAFIVQTEVMREALIRSYPEVAGRVHVIAQPVPSWLLQSGLKRKARRSSSRQGLHLIYPAADYPHKNHALLSRIDPQAAWPVERLILTLDSAANTALMLPWVEYRGFLQSQKMIEAYSLVDGLLFLSKKESYGFPLVEAMFVGLPIVCPNLPYAHALCGSQAIYFEPDQPESLHQALRTLQSRLAEGWWPDWKDRLHGLPASWEDVARSILKIACSGAYD